MLKQLEPLVVDIKEDPEPIIIQSLCVECKSNGETILLMTKIPFFRDILIGSFRCEQCGFRNNEVQFCGELPSHGVNISFKVKNPEDLNRQIIKSEHAILKFEELDLQIPQSKSAQINTIEGILMRVEKQLEYQQQQRKSLEDGSFQKVQEFIEKLKQTRKGEKLPINMKIIDPSGNSNVKNPFAPKLDDRLLISYVPRTLEQIQKMGYSSQNAKIQAESQKIQSKTEFEKMDFTKPLNENNFMHYQPTVFEINCHVCMMPGQMKTCQISIPHFPDLVIMSFHCQHCGAHSTETKNSGEGSDHCTEITLKVNSEQDIKRDLFKSQTCKVQIPKIQLELDYGTLGGSYTTVEGLLEKIKNHVSQMNAFTDSDSQFCKKIKELTDKITKMMTGQIEFSINFIDPLSHSFLQNPYHPEVDPNVLITVRARNEEEDDFLGFTEMIV